MRISENPSDPQPIEPIARSYSPTLYDSLSDRYARDNFDDFVNELEHNMIQLRLLFPTTPERELHLLIGSIWDNSRDLTDDLT